MKTSIFSTEDLVKVYAPPNLHSVMPGNKVMLRSGGPKMTVVKQVDDNAVCQWEGEEPGKLYILTVPLVCLTCWGAE